LESRQSTPCKVSSTDSMLHPN